jgi:hypothetical protein
VQLLKNFPAFYGTRRFIAVFTRTLHWSLSWARSIQSIPPHPISLRPISLLSTYQRFGLICGLIPSGFPTNILYASLFYPIRATCPTHLILFDLIILITFWPNTATANKIIVRKMAVFLSIYLSTHPYILWHGEWKTQLLLGKCTINWDATMQHVTPRNVTNGSTAGNGVYCTVRADSDFMQQQENCWKRLFLLGPSRCYVTRTNGTRVSARRVTPQQRGVAISSQTPPLFEKVIPFQNT